RLLPPTQDRPALRRRFPRHRLQRYQVLLFSHRTARLAHPPTPPRPQGETPARRPLHGRGPTPHRRRQDATQPRLLLDRLLARPPTRRGPPPPGRRHRQRPHDGPRPPRPGRQGPLRPTPLQHPQGPPRLLGHPSPSHLALPRHRPRSPSGRLRRRTHGTLQRPGRLTPCGPRPRTPQGNLSTSIATYLRDPSP